MPRWTLARGSVDKMKPPGPLPAIREKNRLLSHERMLHRAAGLCISIVYTNRNPLMITSVQRWGNSLAIRIPRAFAAQAQLAEDSAVDISVDGDTITVRPARREWTLDELVRKITPSNQHREVGWGSNTGKESW
jgi:antitoxin MazE